MNTIKSIQISDDFIIEYDNSSLKKLKYEIQDNKYIIDICHLSLLEATKIAILCSTYCFINGFSKKLCWIVADEEIKKAISILRLRNIEQILLNDYQTRRVVNA